VLFNKDVARSVSV